MTHETLPESHPTRRGWDLANAGDHEGARRRFDEALARDGDDVDARFGRALCWHRLGEYDLARRDLDAVLRLDPEAAPAYFWRGTAHVRCGDSEAAVADFDRALELDPEETGPLRHRAFLWMREGDPARALDDFEALLEREPEDANAHAHRGYCLQLLERQDEALAALDEALRLAPDDETALTLRAALHQELGDDERAEDDLHRATEARCDEPMETQRRTLIAALLREHFAPHPTDRVTITERVFPLQGRADLQRGLDRLFGAHAAVVRTCGVLTQFDHVPFDFTRLLIPAPNDPPAAAPPQYEEVDIGEDEPVRCLKNGLWLLRDEDHPYAALLAPRGQHGARCGLSLQIATLDDDAGARIRTEFFQQLEATVQEAPSYRGKVLSLEQSSRYFGGAPAITVHRLRTVARNDVILPAATLELLDRNVVEFTRQRPRLARLGLPTKKGLLFYGPPGTGKTHTIHYLADALEGHTTLLVTAEQIRHLDEYMTLARLLQPSIVVLEDVDLVAEDRSHANRYQVVLHQLLNEMDGMRPDAEVLFVLTTNRPEVLETALAGRPGRIDQAIEFPLPDDAGRTRLLRLYACGLAVDDDLVAATVKKTEGVSASFIKELMWRAAQFLVERDADSNVLAAADVDAALDELLFRGGSLNRRLLGAAEAE